MARTYLTLTSEEQTDMVMQTVLGQERSHFAHTLNVARYQEMLKALPPVEAKLAAEPIAVSDTFETRIAKLLTTEQAAVEQHDLLIDRTLAQLPSEATLVTESLQRVRMAVTAVSGQPVITGG